MGLEVLSSNLGAPTERPRVWGFSFGRARERAGARTRCEPDAALESDAASLSGMGRKRSAAELRVGGSLRRTAAGSTRHRRSRWGVAQVRFAKRSIAL